MRVLPLVALGVVWVVWGSTYLGMRVVVAEPLPRRIVEHALEPAAVDRDLRPAIAGRDAEQPRDPEVDDRVDLPGERGAQPEAST